MRSNELLAGVRGDLAVKVFGDEFGPCWKRPIGLLRSCGRPTAPRTSRSNNGGLAGARYRRQQGGNRPTRTESLGRPGCDRNRDRGREAGIVSRATVIFEIVVRLPDGIRNDLEALKSLPVSLPPPAMPG